MARSAHVIKSDADRVFLTRLVSSAEDGSRVEFKGPQRSVNQNSILWGHLSDISRQVRHNGVQLAPEEWKTLFLDALDRFYSDEARVKTVRSLDGTGFVRIGRSSSDLSKKEMADLLTIITEYADRHGVKLACAPLEA